MLNNLPPGVQATYAAVITYVFNPLVLLIFTIGFVVFVWGVVEFLWNMNKGEDAKDGKGHMLYGIIGMFIMVVAYTLVRFIASFYSINL